MTATIPNPGTEQTDPLPVAYRSPFAENYHYYLNAEDAKNNNTDNALDDTDAWTNATIYVGYDVKSTFSADKKFAIWSNRDNQYMHIAVRPNGSNESGQINLERQKYNIWNESSNGANFSYVEANSTNYGLLDNLFMWQLGNDPYNITFKNVAMGKYANPIASNATATLGTTSTSSYCILYWTSHAGVTDTTTPYLTRVYYRGSAANNPQYVVGTINNSNNNWRVEASQYDNYTNGSKLYIRDLTDQAVTVNVLNSHGVVEAQFQAYNNPTATMQSVIPYSMIRAYTSAHALYYDEAHTDAVKMGSAELDATKLTANGGNLYLTYTLGSEWRTKIESSNTPNIYSFDEKTDDNANWYGMRYNAGSGRFIKAATGTLPQETITDSNLSNVQSQTAGQWAFIGTPYNLQIANRYHGFGSRLGIDEGATSSTKPKVYAADATGVVTTWEATNCFASQGTNFVFFRPQGSLNGQNPFFYLGNSSNSSAALSTAASGGEKWDFYWITETTERTAPTATLTLSAASSNVYVDASTTLTATATPAEGHSVTYFAIERETSTDVWEVVGTPYEGTNISGVAEKNATTGVVTLTYNFIPDAEGTYKFRARSITDNNDATVILSTNTTRDGGQGSAVSVTATVKPFTVGSDNYTIVLVDKAGNELYTESNVPASRVSEANSVSGRNGDPLNNDWRSPLVTRYYYYNTPEGAKTNNSSDLFDWASTATTPTVYVGYEVGTDIDLNTKVTYISERVRRSDDDATLVRNASKFGTMYMLKFLNGVDDYMENGKDEVEDTKKKPVYPYANGDGAMYIYDQSRWDAQAEAGASTRTRWPWYLVSPTNDPYHVYVTAWQQSHTDEDTKTNYYNFFRTYYNNTISKVVTTSISDDPKATNTSLTGGATTNVPTQYMLLGTTGHYKLVTSDAVAGATVDATYGGHQTVKTLENYWKNNPTVQTLAGVQNPEANNATLTNKGWHRYESWAYAANWGTDSKNKTYSYGNHWYKTFEMGDGTFDLEPTEIDAVLVLLDNHGWEVMRQKIAKHKEADKYAAAQAALRKFDSPMVEQYKFYGSKSVDHKVRGYHKYNINNGADKALTESDRAGADKVFTSLADYPEKYAGGALMDLYVTYVVKPEYASTYQGAATEEGTSASQFVLRQGNYYAYANGTTLASNSTYDSSNNVYKWYLKPNFNIDTEMGYEYDVDKDGLKTGTILDAAATNTNYYNNGQQGFDPYNLRIQNVSTSTYLTTDANNADLTGSIWSGNGSTVSLTDATTSFTEKGLDETDVNISNATFMAVQDANGNMRLMPRFDYGKVVEGFTTLKEQAAAQPAGNTTHAQTTLLSTPVTYHIIDNSGADVFGALSYEGAGFAVPKEYQSPMVEQYYYHSSLEDAQTNRTTASVTTVSPNAEIYVSYKVSDDFNADKAYTIYGANSYMHACYRYGNDGDDSSKGKYLWWMQNQKVDRDNGNAISLTTLPFLDNTYAWQVGATPDPYNVRFLNKGAGRYLNQSTTGNDNRMEQLAIIETAGEVPATATPFCILYYGDDTDDCTLYNRTYDKYVYDNNGDWRANTSRTGDNRRLTITELPAISINVVNAANEVECTLEGFYKSGCTWSNSFTPFYLDRIYTSGHTFYYTLADAAAGTNAISGTVDDATVTANSAVYVKYTLSSDWGAAVDNDDLTAKKTAQTIKVLPSPDNNNKINWYALRTDNGKYLGFTSATGNLGDVPAANATSDVDDDAHKLAQWALMGTPYNLKLVDRYHGTSSYLAVSKDAKAGDFAFISDGTDGDITAWEVCTGYNKNSKLLIRPQRSLNGETPYLYIGWNGGKNNTSLAMNTGSNLGLDLTWVKETDAKHVTFKLYDRNGHYMGDAANGGISDETIHAVSIGDVLASVFAHTNMQRRYCEYTFYSDAEMTNAVTKASDNLEETVYVKWDYTDDAPVFSQTSWDKRDYQYYMLGVWGFSNYNLMDVEGEGTTESPYTFKPNSDVGTPRDLKHQFAIVGNPYGFKLYNRAADRDIKRNKNLEITFADKEADGTTDTEEITFDLPIVSGRAYTSTETHFRSTKTGRYLNVTGTNENKLFSMTDNAGGNTRFRYIIVPVRVFKEGAVSSTAEKDYRMYALEMNPNNTARTTDARITTNDLRATGNAIGNARDFNHAFCNYTYYQKYDWNTSVSDPVPDDGLSYYGGKDQNKRQFIATYTVDQDAFERLYYLDNSPNHDNAYSSKGKGAESTSNVGSYTTLSNSQLSAVKADITDIYRWKFTGDPYDLQIHNVSMGEFADNYALAVKVPTETSATAPTEAAGTLVLLTEDLKTGDSDTESYGQYSHWEIIKRSDNYYVFWNIETPERYTYSLTSQADKTNKNKLYMTVPPFENGSTTKLNINQVEWNLVDVFNHYDVTWHVMEKTGETTYTEVARDTKVVDENVTLTIEDLPTSVKRHFCDYEKMYSDAACTTEITEHTVNAATNIYVPYTLDSGAPDFCAAEPTSSTAEKYWYELGYPEMGSFMYYDNAKSKYNYNYILASDLRSQTTEQYAYYRWALVGTPYHVMLYNKATENYLTTDGSTLSMSSTGTVFAMYDSKSRDLCALYDPLTKTYPTATAGVDTKNYGDGTAADFTNTYGLVKVTLILHYSDKTLRMYDSNGDHTLDAYCKDGRTEKIENKRYQKIEKEIDDIMPSEWRRPFCKYTYYWDSKNSDDVKPSTVVSTINQDMVTAHANGTTDIYVHVTYDFETNAPFKWSTNENNTYEGKHWYYLVNNHRPNGELGKMVYRDSGPKLRVSTSLKENQLYLNNFEWCVIGDPYGFKMLNRYDPDQRYDEYLRVMDNQDSHGDGLQLEQSGTDSQNIFEMMPGQYSYNFWMHPVYSDYIGEDEGDSDNDDVFNEYSYVGNNYNGSAAIIPNDQRSMTYLKTNSAANFRLEIQSDHTLSEYVKYAGFVGGLKYDKVTDDMRTDATDGDLSDDDKAAVRALIDDPENIVQMTQGYYRIVPYTQEGGSEHKYIRGYLDDRERAGSDGYNRNLKVETQTAAEYDPASIFWFEGTTSDGTENGYPRYFIKTQGLILDHTGLNSINAESNYKCRYENLGGAIAQIKIASLTGDMPHDYLSCTSNATETSTDQCFDEQAGQYKTRFYLQKVGEGGNELSFKLKLNAAFGKSYASIYVPFDIEIPENCDAKPFYGLVDHDYSSNPNATDKYTLFCRTLDYIKSDYGEKFIPACTPVIIKSDAAAAEITFIMKNNAPNPDEKLRGDLSTNAARVNKIDGTYLSIQDTRADLYTFGREKNTNGELTGRVGFFKRSNTNNRLNPNRVFYISPFHKETQGSRGAAFVFEETPDIATGVSDVGTGVLSHQYSDGAVYDLQGRKVADDYESALSNRHLLKGIYIINGKKVVIK